MPTARRSNLSNQLRTMICTKYDQGKPLMLIAVELEIPYKTVVSVTRLYRTTGRILSNIKNCGRKELLTEEAKNVIMNRIHDDVSTTLKEIQIEVENKTSIKTSTTTIHRAIKGFSYTFKRVSLIPAQRNAVSNIGVRRDYASAFMLLSVDKIIFLDEMGVNCSMRRRYGRSLAGTTPRKVVTTIRSRNISISAAISRKSVLHFQSILQAYNGDRYAAFISDLIQILKRERLRNQVFIMDNCSMHKVEVVRDTIQKAGHKLLFLPPYSPQLNPIEELFSVWKGKIRAQNANSTEELMQAIENAHLELTTEHCAAFYDRMQGFIAKALREEIF